MIKVRFAAPLFLLPLLAACFPIASLHPFYLENDPFFDERLLGSWANEDDFQMIFEPSGPARYRVWLANRKEPGKKFELEGRLFRLGELLLLDLSSPAGEGDRQEELLIQHQIPVHTLYRLEIEGPQLRLAYLDDEFVATQIKAGNSGLLTTELDDSLFLVSPTSVLQDFILRFAAAGAFSDSQLLNRVPAG